MLLRANLPAVLDQGLIDLDNHEACLTAIRVRQVRSVLEGVDLPCGFPGCSYCDPLVGQVWHQPRR
jgi:hypothetical protein